MRYVPDVSALKQSWPPEYVPNDVVTVAVGGVILRIWQITSGSHKNISIGSVGQSIAAKLPKVTVTRIVSSKDDSFGGSFSRPQESVTPTINS